MGMDQFYQAYETTLMQAANAVMDFAHTIQKDHKAVEHISYRLKSPESVEKKLVKKGHEPTLEQAKAQLTDLVGVRLVCRFVNDIYTVSDLLQTRYQVLSVKDYIANPKPNGYRSCHMILSVPVETEERVAVEIQLRTISQDAWACLEHQMKYKKQVQNEGFIRDELRRCADELAATDLCMQTIREFIELEGALPWDG